MKPKIGNNSPYERHHPLWARWLLFLTLCSPMLAALLISIFPSHEYVVSYVNIINIKPKTKTLDLRGVNALVELPIDRVRNHHISLSQSSMRAIQNKIDTDLAYFGAGQESHGAHKNLAIKTSVNVFYPAIKGAGWKTGIGRVNLDITASLNDSTVIAKNYQTTYSSSGLDNDYEGSILTDDLGGATVVLGVSLRKTLDKFYTDLSQVLAKDEVSQLKNVLFKMGSTELEASSETDLLSAVNFMKSNPRTVIELDGYADNQGDLVKDRRLSLDRAKTVKSFLTDHGIKARRIKVKGFGATNTISNASGNEYHRLNRRVEFVFIRG